MSSLPGGPAGLSFPSADTEWGGDPALTAKQPQGHWDTLELSTRCPEHQAILSPPWTESFTMLAMFLRLHSKKICMIGTESCTDPECKPNHLKGFKNQWWQAPSITRSSGRQWAGISMFSKFPGGCTVKLRVKMCYGWWRMDISEPEFPNLFDHISFFLLLFSSLLCQEALCAWMMLPLKYITSASLDSLINSICG